MSLVPLQQDLHRRDRKTPRRSFQRTLTFHTTNQHRSSRWSTLRITKPCLHRYAGVRNPLWLTEDQFPTQRRCLWTIYLIQYVSLCRLIPRIWLSRQKQSRIGKCAQNQTHNPRTWADNNKKSFNLVTYTDQPVVEAHNKPLWVVNYKDFYQGGSRSSQAWK